MMLLVGLDLSLAESGPEGFSTVFKESYRQFCPFAVLVRPSSHLPLLFRSCNVFSANGTFCHDIPFCMIIYDLHKTLSIILSVSSSITRGV